MWQAAGRPRRLSSGGRGSIRKQSSQYGRNAAWTASARLPGGARAGAGRGAERHGAEARRGSVRLALVSAHLSGYICSVGQRDICRLGKRRALPALARAAASQGDTRVSR